MTVRLVIYVLGVELLHLELGQATDTPAADSAADLSGGELGSTIISAGTTDLHLGFTNGLEARGARGRT